jgi:hypothetical protein
MLFLGNDMDIYFNESIDNKLQTFATSEVVYLFNLQVMQANGYSDPIDTILNEIRERMGITPALYDFKSVYDKSEKVASRFDARLFLVGEGSDVAKEVCQSVNNFLKEEHFYSRSTRANTYGSRTLCVTRIYNMRQVLIELAKTSDFMLMKGLST